MNVIFICIDYLLSVHWNSREGDIELVKDQRVPELVSRRCSDSMSGNPIIMNPFPTYKVVVPNVTVREIPSHMLISSLDETNQILPWQNTILKRFYIFYMFLIVYTLYLWTMHEWYVYGSPTENSNCTKCVTELK